MLYLASFTLIFAVLSSLVSGLALPWQNWQHARATSCLRCGGCAFKLKVSGSGISYVDGSFLDIGNYAIPQTYWFGDFASGTTFKLDSSCRLIEQTKTQSAQVFSGTDNKNHAMYLNNGIATVNGKKLVEATCSISTAAATLNQLTCPNAGSNSGMAFYTSRGTVEAGTYEIGQYLLTLSKAADKGSNFLPVKLTAVAA